jgi:hypothetical protein
MLRRVALVRTVVSEEPSASFIRVTRIGELGTTLAFRRVCRLLIAATVVPSSSILVTLRGEELSSSETSVLARATQRNIPEDNSSQFHLLTLGEEKLRVSGTGGAGPRVAMEEINCWVCGLNSVGPGSRTRHVMWDLLWTQQTLRQVSSERFGFSFQPFIPQTAKPSSTSVIQGWYTRSRTGLSNSELSSMKIAIFWDVTPSVSWNNRLFGGTSRLHPQGEKRQWGRTLIVPRNGFLPSW